MTTFTMGPTTGPTTGDLARGLRTVALVKQVPVGGGTGELDASGRLRRGGQATEMNPWCRRAVTQAVTLAAAGPGGRSTVLTMGPPAAADVLREALACGVDHAVQLSDPALAGSDCLATARALASAIAVLGEVDLVLVGRSSVDGNTSAVGAMVAEILGLPFAGPVLGPELTCVGGVVEMRSDVQDEEGTRAVTLRLPAVVSVAERSCKGAKAPPEMWPGGGNIRTLTLAEVAGGRPPVSPTQVAGVRRTRQARRPVILSGDLDAQVERALDLWEARQRAGDERVRERPVTPVRAPSVRAGQIVVLAGGSGARALLGEAAVLARRVGARVVAVTATEPDVARLATWGADEVITLGREEPRPVAAALASWIAARGMPWAVLGTARSWDRDVLGRLAVRLDAGLMSDLIRVHARTDDATGATRVVGVKPSGDSALAEIVSHGPTQIATLRSGCLDLREPRPMPGLLPVRHLEVGPDDAVRAGRRVPEHDYDGLDRADVVIGVGLGVDPAHYDKLRPLRELLGAELAATRKVTDAGRLPHFRQVGITARDIAPRLYLAIGISGNTNHLMGVARAGTVLAVNNDASAPVFGRCDIGIVADWREVVARLAAALERRRSSSVSAR
jgi:electron transfer flavoprotein alpha subunit